MLCCPDPYDKPDHWATFPAEEMFRMFNVFLCLEIGCCVYISVLVSVWWKSIITNTKYYRHQQEIPATIWTTLMKSSVKLIRQASTCTRPSCGRAHQVKFTPCIQWQVGNLPSALSTDCTVLYSVLQSQLRQWATCLSLRFLGRNSIIVTTISNPKKLIL